MLSDLLQISYQQQKVFQAFFLAAATCRFLTPPALGRSWGPQSCTPATAIWCFLVEAATGLPQTISAPCHTCASGQATLFL